MATVPEAPKRTPSQEQLLVEYVRRLEKQRRGRRAVHVHLSKLRPFNRREQHVRAAATSFEPLVSGLYGQIFILKNADLFFFYKAEAHPQTVTTVQKVRFLFSDDPFMERAEAATEFATWYDAETDYDLILHMAEDMAEVEAPRETGPTATRAGAREAVKARQEKGEPLTPEVLGKVEDALARADLSNLVRRQFVCRVDKNMVPEQVFSELFISMNDLRETVLPGVNLLANRWLFQHLTLTLDRRMLAMLSKTDRITISGDISFNVNVSTMLSNEFLAFDDNITASRRGALVLELQMLDIFADLGAYLFAREFVQEKGYRICLDGLTHETMFMVDRERLGADLVKIIWHAQLADGGEAMHDKIRALVMRTGAERIVLCRVDNREAVDFGHSLGVTLFQGRHVEQLIAEDNRRREMLRLKRRIERGSPGAETT